MKMKNLCTFTLIIENTTNRKLHGKTTLITPEEASNTKFFADFSIKFGWTH